MAITTISLEAPSKTIDPLNNRVLPLRGKLRKLVDILLATVSGGLTANATLRYGTKRAFGTVVIASASGDQTITINGVDIVVAHGASDQVDSTAIVAAINASTDALVKDLVRASNYAATVTLASAVAGDWVEIMGVKLTATGGTGTATEVDQFTIGGTDTQDAVTLVTCINAHPVLSELVKASSSSGVVTVRALKTTPDSLALASSHATRVALSGAVFAATTTVCISALWKGTPGNCITLAVSGTGPTASGTRLTGGTNGTTTTF